MKTIEIAVRFNAQVTDDIAEAIAKENENFWVNIPMDKVTLQNGSKGTVAAEFNEYETMNISDLSE